MNIQDQAAFPPPSTVDQDALFLDVENIGVTFPSNDSLRIEASNSDSHRILKNDRGRILGVKALEDISFRLRQGDRLAVIGRNGSGKTTLLQTLSGILSPDHGRIVMRGKTTSLININLGMQPEATGHRNITLRGLASGYTHKDIEARRSSIEAFCELGDFLHLPMETYSAGMRMRLIFAIATAFDPEILVLDEWLSAGDVVFKQKATKRMQEFVAKAGILILASHSRQLLLENCNLGVWLDDGQIKRWGSAEEVMDAYEHAQKDA
ncbi:MAG: ABC transporter ATP-binding protein [Pseudomonadota bacterium]